MPTSIISRQTTSTAYGEGVKREDTKIRNGGVLSKARSIWVAWTYWSRNSRAVSPGGVESDGSFPIVLAIVDIQLTGFGTGPELNSL